jgi:hypothetical protein
MSQRFPQTESCRRVSLHETAKDRLVTASKRDSDKCDSWFFCKQLPAGATALYMLSPVISSPEAGELVTPSNHYEGRVTPHCNGDSCNAN